jgi:hypothetical protein
MRRTQRMPNDEFRMSNQTRNPNDETSGCRSVSSFEFRHSSFLRHSGVVIRHSEVSSP